MKKALAAGQKRGMVMPSDGMNPPNRKQSKT